MNGEPHAAKACWDRPSPIRFSDPRSSDRGEPRADYRNLDELERLQVVDRTYVSQRAATYDLTSKTHGRRACETCGPGFWPVGLLASSCSLTVLAVAIVPVMPR